MGDIFNLFPKGPKKWAEKRIVKKPIVKEATDGTITFNKAEIMNILVKIEQGYANLDDRMKRIEFEFTAMNQQREELNQKQIKVLELFALALSKQVGASK